VINSTTIPTRPDNKLANSELGSTSTNLTLKLRRPVLRRPPQRNSSETIEIRPTIIESNQLKEESVINPIRAEQKEQASLFLTGLRAGIGAFNKILPFGRGGKGEVTSEGEKKPQSFSEVIRARSVVKDFRRIEKLSHGDRTHSRE
jgi:hypothetical protein